MASLYAHASVHSAFEESVSSKATQVDQQASPCLRCLLFSFEGQAPILVWSNASYSRNTPGLLTVTSVDNPELNVFALFLFMAFLLSFISIENVYKRLDVRVLESATLLNLIVLSSGTLYRWESTDSRSKLLMVSIGISFTQFCVIVVLSLIKSCLSAGWWFRRDQDNDVIDYDDVAHERIEDPELEPLINDTPRPITMPAFAKYTK